MTAEHDEAYYARKALEQLDLADATTDPSAKAIHLDSAARYATQRELAERASRRATGAEGKGGREAV